VLYRGVEIYDDLEVVNQVSSRTVVHRLGLLLSHFELTLPCLSRDSKPRQRKHNLVNYICFD